MNDAYEINHMWTADMKSNEEWSSQLWSQFLQLCKEAWKKNSYDCKNCDHNCEDHSSFDFISAVHIWFISYASFIYIIIFHGNIWTHNWPAPNVSGFIAQLVERRTGIARSRVKTRWSPEFLFRLLYAIVKIAITTARIVLHLEVIIICRFLAVIWSTPNKMKIGWAWRKRDKGSLIKRSVC